MPTTTGAAYPLPLATTEEETRRLNLHHEVTTCVLGGTHSASLPQKIECAIDLGCGTGIWTREFAALYPEAKIIGVDLNPPPLLSTDPRNIKFVAADLEKEWSFVLQPFDYIWARFLVTAIRSWSQLLQRISRNLVPGGRFEIFETILEGKSDDASVGVANSAFIRFMGAMSGMLRTKGIELDMIPHLGKMIEASGLELEKEELGRIYLDAEIAAMKDGRQTPDVVKKYNEGLSLGMSRVTETLFDAKSKPTLVEAKLLLEEVREDLRLNSKSRGYSIAHISLVARKPR